MKELKIYARFLELGLLAMLIATSVTSCHVELPTQSKGDVGSGTPQKPPHNANNRTVSESAIELERFRTLWRTHNISHYNFRASLYVGGMRYFAEPVEVQVRGNDAVSIQPLSKTNKGSVEGYAEFETIEKIFEVIGMAIEKNLEFDVTYNKKFGYPENVLIYASSSVTDAYKRLKIHSFQIVREERED